MVGERARGEIRDGLGEAEGDDEGEDRRGRCELEVPFADEREDTAFEADHAAHERVECDQERELCRVLPEAERWRAAHRRVGAAPRRLSATIASCPGGRGGVSRSNASANASGWANASIAFC